MQPEQMEQILRNVDRRVDGIEQILPTLTTKADLQAAVEPLATKAELQAAVEPLATKAELLEVEADLRTAITQSEQRMRTHFDVVAESLRDDIQLIATALVSLSQRGH